MKAIIEIELEPFTVPTFVRPVAKAGRREDGWQDAPGYPLSDLDSLTLDQLCNDFRNSVFKKAGKEQPPTAA